VEISFATFLRALGAIALAWAWWHLWQWLLVFVVGAMLAVALDPAVRWLEARGLKRAFGAPLLVVSIVLAIGIFIALAAGSLQSGARELGTSLREFRDTVVDDAPAELRQAAAAVAPSAGAFVSAARGLLGGLASIVVALVVTVYLLLDGRRTFYWLMAFVPVRSRKRALDTAECSRHIVAAYIRGNIITSILAAVFTWIALLAMHVPAALLLAVLAGVFDVLPVVGFFLSAAPAILLALTVSPAVAIGVAVFYVGYNMVESYYISPKVYGRELALSDFAVIVAFTVGATLGGVLGALIALPVAAAYPAVENIWFDRPGETDTADEHRRIEAQPEH
jgi:predicted PurR-regulated permease PerM